VQRNSSYATLASYKTGSSMKNSIKPTVAKPEPKKKGLFSKVGGFLKDAADFLFMDDIRTLADPNASVLDKSIAFISLIPNPFGKAVKGVKLGVDAATSLGRKADDVKAVVKGLEKAGGTKGTDKIDKTYSRPSGYRKGVRDEAWEKAKGADGEVRDPVNGKKMDKEEPWDMGHKPGYEFRKHQKSAQERGISRKQFLDEHNNPDHYRPELPSTNRSHKGEDLTDNYFGD
ncbi:HNH/ENDO VII family nuclease, partial [Ornithinibacillus contaminans]|uniref:HNH/ENDO VII family nuclease n=1 Tax=Ornithinibacillus contaminans TaxID=694055 RepID=UPI000B14CD4C